MNNWELLDQDELYALAKLDFSRQDYESTLIKTKFILARGNFPVDVLALTGKVYASLQLFERAKQDLSRFLEYAPDALVERFQLGMVEYDLGEKAPAKQHWLAVLEKSEHYTPALFNLGKLCMEEGALDEARDYLNLVMEYAPDESEYIAMADGLLSRLNLQ